MGYLRNAAASNGMELEEYMPTVIAHGMIHLLGYDHQTDEEYTRMMAKERRIRNKLKQMNIVEPPPENDEATLRPFVLTDKRGVLSGK